MRRVLKNSKCEVLSKHSLTGPRFEGYWSGTPCWRGGYTVDRREIECGKGAVRILVPHYEAIVTASTRPP